MIHPRTLVLIDKLCEMTRQKKIAWQLGEDDTLIHDTEGYRVILTNSPEELILTDPLGRELERADEQELAETTSDDGTPYAVPVHDMIRNAGRVAKGTEFAIEKVLAGLDLDGDGIPDLPPPPGVEDIAESGDEAAEALAEDITEETAPFFEAAKTPVEPTEEVTEAVPEENADIARAVAEMADEINSEQPETSPPSTPSLGGFGTFAAGATVLGGIGAAATSLTGNDAQETNEEATPEPELTTEPVDLELSAEAMQLADLQAGSADTIENPAAPPSDITSPVEEVAEASSAPDIIDPNVMDEVPEVPTALSSQEQSIASLVESVAATDTPPAPDPEPVATPKKMFSLSGISKSTGITGAVATAASALGGAKEAVADAAKDAGEAASSLADSASDAVGEAAENTGGILGKAKDAVADGLDDTKDGTRKIVDDIGDTVEDEIKPNGDAKPSTRFNPWK